jgi:hypothetical protein
MLLPLPQQKVKPFDSTNLFASHLHVLLGTELVSVKGSCASPYASRRM